MIIRVSEKEMEQIRRCAEHLELDMPSFPVACAIGNVNHVKTEQPGKEGYYEVKIKKAFTVPVLKLVEKYYGAVIPMLKGIVSLSQGLAEDIDEIESKLREEEMKQAEEIQSKRINLSKEISKLDRPLSDDEV